MPDNKKARRICRAFFRVRTGRRDGKRLQTSFDVWPANIATDLPSSDHRI
jgi:hypothetical protein